MKLGRTVGKHGKEILTKDQLMVGWTCSNRKETKTIAKEYVNLEGSQKCSNGNRHCGGLHFHRSSLSSWLSKLISTYLSLWIVGVYLCVVVPITELFLRVFCLSFFWCIGNPSWGMLNFCWCFRSLNSVVNYHVDFWKYRFSVCSVKFLWFPLPSRSAASRGQK